MVDPKFRDLLALLNNFRPSIRQSGMTKTDALIQLGRREGFDMLIGIFPLLTQLPPEPLEDVPATYGSEQFNWETGQFSQPTD